MILDGPRGMKIAITDILPDAIKATNIRIDDSEIAKQKRKENLEAIKASIKKCGLINPIKVGKLTYEEVKTADKSRQILNDRSIIKYGILEGHQRYEAYYELSKKFPSSIEYRSIPAIVEMRRDVRGEREAALMANIIKSEMSWEERAGLVYELYYNEKEENKDISIRKFTEKIENELKLSKSTIQRMIAFAKKNDERSSTVSQDNNKQIETIETVLSNLNKKKKVLLLKKEFKNFKEKKDTIEVLNEMKESIMQRLKEIKSIKIVKNKVE